MKKDTVSIPVGLFIVAAVTVLLSVFSSCSGTGNNSIKDFRPPDNLIIIVIDALRADHLGCYGNERDTSPFIDSLAQKSIVFDRAYSNSSYTLESVSVLFSGRLPSSSGSTGWRARPRASVKNLGQLFKDAGFRTGLLSNSNVIVHPNFKQGFDTTWFSGKWGVSRNGPELSSRAGAFVRQCQENNQKFMLYLHYLDPHGPYHPPIRFFKKFGGKAKQSKGKDPEVAFGMLPLYGKVRNKCTQLMAEGFGPGDPRFEDMVRRYDAEIALVDESIKQLFDTLKKEQLLGNTAILITADHGEEFLEHRFVEHAWTLYNESLHIPMILSLPGLTEPRRFDAPVSIVDVLPTVLGLCEIPHSRTDLDGTPLFSVEKKGMLVFTPPLKPIIAELLIQHRNLVRVIIKNNWKYIAAQKWLPPGERIKNLANVRGYEMDKSRHLDTWGPVVKEELYHMEDDPGETTNLLNSQEVKRIQFRKLYKDYKLYCRKMGIKQGKNNEPGKLSKKEKEKLKTLGYL